MVPGGNVSGVRNRRHLTRWSELKWIRQAKAVESLVRSLVSAIDAAPCRDAVDPATAEAVPDRTNHRFPEALMEIAAGIKRITPAPTANDPRW
jgi:hypothetical protein